MLQKRKVCGLGSNLVILLNVSFVVEKRQFQKINLKVKEEMDRASV